MKKFVTFWLSAFLTVSACASMTACQRIPDTEDVLIIEAYEGGYGTSFLTRLGERFMELNEGKSVYVTPSFSLTHNETNAKLKAGPKYTPTDMFFSNTANFNQFVSKGKEMVSGYDCVLEDLSGVLERNVYGENITVGEKMKPEYIDYFTYPGGGVYSLAWATGVSGIVYHADVFEEKGWPVPLTTDQMTGELFPMIKADPEGWSPVTWPGSIGYWIYGIMVWWAQYDGIDEFNRFFLCKDENDDYSYEVFAQEGRYEALQVLEDIIADKNGNSAYGSVSFTHTDSQLLFLEQKNKIAMIPNGDWLENEMSSNFEIGSLDIKMMKTPVISSIIHRTPSIPDDAVLKEVVKFVDGDRATKPDGVTDEDVQIIRDARRISFSNGFDHNIQIPVYANAKELAKEFIRFMASDEAQEIYYEETGSLLPFLNSEVVLENEKYLSKMTTFARSKFALMENSVNVTAMYYRDPLFYKAGLRPFNQTIWPDPVIGGIGNDAVSAAQFYANEYAYVRDRWDIYCINAGIANM